jgi:hypothetical protein
MLALGKFQRLAFSKVTQRFASKSFLSTFRYTPSHEYIKVSFEAYLYSCFPFNLQVYENYLRLMVISELLVSLVMLLKL